MSTTYNGSPVVSRDACRSWKLPGSVAKFLLLNAPSGFILVCFLSWFNDTIERVHGGTLDDWGWVPERVGRGQTSGITNHAAGEAADVNALKHVQGKSGTFSYRQRIRIVACLRLYYPVLGWGGLWRSRDEMHFERKPGVSRAQINGFARKLMQTPRGERVMAANEGSKAMLVKAVY